MIIVFVFFLFFCLSVNILGYVIFLSFYPENVCTYLKLCKNHHMDSAKIFSRNRKSSFYKFFQNLFQNFFQLFRIFKIVRQSCLMIYRFFIYYFDFQYFRNSIPFLLIEFHFEFSIIC